MEIVFWASVFLVIYPYLVYPALIWLLGKLFPRPVKKAEYEPFVSVMIAAFNEADCIEATVRNKLEQDYPADRFEIIVISDGSEDGTDDIVTGFADQGVRLIRQEPRNGKASALNLGVREARGEILVFSDANSIFDRAAIREIVKNFADPDVGYVTGSLSFVAGEGNVSSSGSDAYINHENSLRVLETRFDSVIGVNGGVDAIRKSLYMDIPQALITDFVLPLHVLETGHRVVYDAGVKSFEEPNEAIDAEFRMRVRVALRALQGLRFMKVLFNPLRYPRAFFSIVSHKVIRYLGPVFLLGALVSNVALAQDSGFYCVLLVLQLLVYVLGGIAVRVRLPGILRKVAVVPAYFLVTNAAFLLAIFKFLRGENMATWRPRAG